MHRPDHPATTVSPVMKIVPVLLALLLIGAAPGHAQTWQTDPAFGKTCDQCHTRAKATDYVFTNYQRR